MTYSQYTADRATLVVVDSGWSPDWNTGALLYQYDFYSGDEFAALARMGVLCSVAAGNSGKSDGYLGVSETAADPNVLCVSASTGSGTLANWSQRDPWLTDIAADDTDVAIANRYGTPYRVSGTSFAAPQVAATVAPTPTPPSGLLAMGG